MDDDMLDDELQTDADSFGEWIEQVAESRGVSEDELLHQLMSSYWMMDELANVIDDLEIEAGRGDSETETRSDERISAPGADYDRGRSGDDREFDSTEAERDQPGIAAADEHDEGVIALIETLKDWKSERERPESGAVDENLIDLIRVIQEGNQTASASSMEAEAASRWATSGEIADVNETVQLIRALKEFSEPSESADLREQLASEQKYQELRDQIEDLETAVESTAQDVQRVEETSQQRTSELAKKLQHIDSRLDSIEETVAQKPDAATVDKLEGALDDVADQVTTVQSRVDTRFDEVENEFDNVEQLLTHLFDQVDENAAESDGLAERLDSIQSRLSVLDDLEAAGKLQRKANRAGITAADCRSCGESVAVGQLTEPECPYCNTEFDDLASGKKWGLFSHHTLTQANSAEDSHRH